MSGKRLLRTDDIRRYLQDKKGELKERSRRWSMCSDSSDCSNSSLRSLPQYSSYRAFSSQGSFNKMSGLPASKSKSASKIVPRGLSTKSKEDVSNGKTSGIPTPGAVSRENSFTKSHLPVMKREVSTPNMKRESSIPMIKREDSMPHMNRRAESPKSAQKTPSRPSSAQPLLKRETPSAVRREGSFTQVKKGTPSAVRPRGAVPSSTPPVASKATDDLKVGDRVNISGSSKKGVIQYIGETKFAKGDWAGVVLDEAAGKNDGTVAGVRYFQCQPNYGVFVKVEKLVKLGDVTDQNYRPHGTPSPRDQTVAKGTPVKSAENVTVPGDLKLGDFVSIGDTRAGYLRYLGDTGFAKGVWCGVELKEPLGKNDGAVAGTRYFQCEPKHGLFAPVHKVNKILDPSVSENIVKAEEISTKAAPLVTAEKTDEVIMLVAEQVKEPEAAPAVEKYDASLTSKIASMQLQLQDRENEIKKLLKDREVDRTESNGLLEQYQQTENKLTSLRITYDKLQRENEDEIKRLQTVASNTDKVKGSLESQLDEEKRKLEDLQFQLEEQLVTRELSSEADKESVVLLEDNLKEKNAELEELKKAVEDSKHSEEDIQNKYSDLEFQLAETNERDIQSSQSMRILQDKLKALEEALNEAKDESDEHTLSLNGELLKRDSEIELLKEDIKTRDEGSSDHEFQIKKYRDELNETIEAKAALNKDIFGLNAQIQDKDSEMATFQSDVESFKSDNKDIKSKLKTAESKVENLLSEKQKLEEEVLQLARSSGDSTSQATYVNEQLQVAKRENTVLKDEKSALEIKVDSVLQNIEETKETSAKERSKLEQQQNEKANGLQESISSLNETIANLKVKENELEKELKDAANKLSVSYEEQGNIKKQLSGTEETLKIKNSKLEDLSAKNSESAILQSNLQQEIQNLKKDIEEKTNSIQTLNSSKSDADQTYASLLSSHETLKLELESVKNEHKSIEENLEMISKEKDALSEENVKVCQAKDAKINELDLEKKEIEERKSATDSKNLELVKYCDGLKQRVLVAQEEAQIFQDKMRQLQADLNQGSDVASKLQHEVFLMREEVTFCKEKILTLENTRDQLKERCACLNREKDEAHVDHNKLLSLKEGLEGDIHTLKSNLEESMQREVNIRQSLEGDRVRLQNSVETSLSQLQQKEGELSSWRVKAQQLEKKVAEQESQIQNLENEVANNLKNEAVKNLDNGVNEDDTVVNKLKEELENKNNQINFLNSVVVELQNKFTAAEQKVRLLETGEGLFAESDGLDDTISPIRPGIKQRMFCDICDEFDLHETEDCPTQSSLDDIGTQYNAPRGEERPYCTICEVFDHRTEDCDDEETF